MANVNRDKSSRKKIKSKAHSFGTSERPRLSIFRSNKNLYIQAIDDQNGVTLASMSTLNIEEGKRNKTDESVLVGKGLAEKLKGLNVMRAIFDRGKYRYHGRVKSLADSIREGGINF